MNVFCDSVLHIMHCATHLTDPETIILCMGAESSIKVNPTKALSRDPKYASRTSGDTGERQSRAEQKMLRQVSIREAKIGKGNGMECIERGKDAAQLSSAYHSE